MLFELTISLFTGLLGKRFENSLLKTRTVETEFQLPNSGRTFFTFFHFRRDLNGILGILHLPFGQNHQFFYLILNSKKSVFFTGETSAVTRNA